MGSCYGWSSLLLDLCIVFICVCNPILVSVGNSPVFFLCQQIPPVCMCSSVCSWDQSTNQPIRSHHHTLFKSCVWSWFFLGLFCDVAGRTVLFCSTFFLIALCSLIFALQFTSLFVDFVSCFINFLSFSLFQPDAGQKGRDFRQMPAGIHSVLHHMQLTSCISTSVRAATLTHVL